MASILLTGKVPDRKLKNSITFLLAHFLKNVNFFLAGLILAGCTLHQAQVIKTEDGVIFKSNNPAKLVYKDKDIEAEYDSRSQSLLRTLIEGATLQGLTRK